MERILKWLSRHRKERCHVNLVDKHIQAEKDKKQKRLEEQRRIISGRHINAFMVSPDGREMPIGELQSITYSNDNSPVFEIGSGPFDNALGTREVTATLSDVEIDTDAIRRLFGLESRDLLH